MKMMDLQTREDTSAQVCTTFQVVIHTALLFFFYRFHESNIQDQEVRSAETRRISHSQGSACASVAALGNQW